MKILRGHDEVAIHEVHRDVPVSGHSLCNSGCAIGAERNDGGRKCEERLDRAHGPICTLPEKMTTLDEDTFHGRDFERSGVLEPGPAAVMIPVAVVEERNEEAGIQQDPLSHGDPVSTSRAHAARRLRAEAVDRKAIR